MAHPPDNRVFANRFSDLKRGWMLRFELSRLRQAVPPAKAA
jgi:hypothetical protein